MKDFAERCTFLPVFRSNVPFLSVRSRILVVELEKAETTSTSRSIRTTFSKSLAAYQSSVSVLSVRSHILVVELEKAETTSTSRSIRTTCTKSFALLRSSGSFLSAFSRILFLIFPRSHRAFIFTF